MYFFTSCLCISRLNKLSCSLIFDVFVPDVGVRTEKVRSWHSSDTRHWIDYFTLLKVQTTCNCSKISLCSQGFLAPALSAPFVTFPNEREITGEPIKTTTCYKALQELEFYYLLSCMVGKFFRNWKFSVLEHQNNLADGWESVVISSVSSDFQRIKLEDKRLLLSSNSWKCPSRLKLISPWNLIPMWEVCDPEMEEKGALHFYAVFVPVTSRAFLTWKNMTICMCVTSSTAMADLQPGSLVL